MTAKELLDYMYKWNEEHEIKSKGGVFEDDVIIYGVVVFSESNFPKNWDLCKECPDIRGRSYIFDNINKAVIPGQLGYSIFAQSLDGADSCRIERYMLGVWDVEDCYLSDKDGNRLEVK